MVEELIGFVEWRVYSVIKIFEKVNWWFVSIVSSFHVLAAYFCYHYFTLEGVQACVILYILTALGITLGYHRLLTHGSFKAHWSVRWTVTILGVLAAEMPPIYWVAVHRKHHKFSDKEGDPHSPLLNGFWWAHMLWLTIKRISGQPLSEVATQYAPDLQQEFFMRFMGWTYLVWHAGLIAGLIALGRWIDGYMGWHTAISLVAYGYFLRICLVHHCTWLINSATHMMGSRKYNTTDDSRNSDILAAVTMGEGYHNNHHAHQTQANHGEGSQLWLDFTYMVICVLEAYGLVWDVKRFELGRPIRNTGSS